MFALFFNGRSGLCDVGNGELDDSWWVIGDNGKHIFHRNQWGEVEEAVHTPK